MPLGTLVRRVGLLCGREAGIRAPYADFARDLGARLGRAGIGLVHGGVPTGMIGGAVRAALTAGSHVISAVPHRMLLADATTMRDCEVYVVRSNDECRHMVRRFADAFVVLPGGIDTLDQFSELVAAQQTSDSAKPIVLANLAGYFDPLLSQLDRAVADAFVTPAQRHMIDVADTVDGVLCVLTGRYSVVETVVRRDEALAGERAS